MTLRCQLSRVTRAVAPVEDPGSAARAAPDSDRCLHRRGRLRRRRQTRASRAASLHGHSGSCCRGYARSAPCGETSRRTPASVRDDRRRAEVERRMRHSRIVMSAGIVDSTTSIVCASTASDSGEEVMRGVFRRADAVASGRVPGVRPWSPAVGLASCPGPGGSAIKSPVRATAGSGGSCAQDHRPPAAREVTCRQQVRDHGLVPGPARMPARDRVELVGRGGRGDVPARSPRF